jgi:phage tail P2-like protein
MSDLLPYNATTQERALSESVARLGELETPIRNVWNADTCPPQMLAWLAWAFSVDQWDVNWTDQQKRQFIKTSADVHRYKGTIGAVRDALRALQFDVQIQEWFNQLVVGDPYTFILLLTADQIGVDQNAFRVLLDVVSRTKNLRSHLSRIELTARTRAGPCLVAAAGVGHEVTLPNYAAPFTVLNDTTVCI